MSLLGPTDNGSKVRIHEVQMAALTLTSRLLVIPSRQLTFLTATFPLQGTVIGSQSGSLHSKWISQYLRHFSTEMAEIWSPGTFFKDVWTHKISALYHLYFQTYETFSRNH